MKMECKRKTVVGIVLGLAILLAGGTVLHAHFGGPCGPRGFGNPEEHVAMVCAYLSKKLDLDASQQQQLDVISGDLLKNGKNLHQLRTTARQELVSILRADTVDMEGLQRLQTQHQETLDEFIKQAGDRLVEFVNILTPSQRQRLAELIENHEAFPSVH